MRRRLLTALAAGTLAIAACGDDEPGAPEEGAPPPDAQTQPLQTTPSAPSEDRPQEPPDDAGGGSFGY